MILGSQFRPRPQLCDGTRLGVIYEPRTHGSLSLLTLTSWRT
jgi:hypothetical protein